MSTPEDERARLQQVRRSALGSRLRQLRAARNLSQEALARRAGMDRSFYSNIETGAVSPRVDRLWDIAAALHVPITELFREAP
jgi:transcriptional regulator with XRE-family HTH domain